MVQKNLFISRENKLTNLRSQISTITILSFLICLVVSYPLQSQVLRSGNKTKNLESGILSGLEWNTNSANRTVFISGLLPGSTLKSKALISLRTANRKNVFTAEKIKASSSPEVKFLISTNTFGISLHSGVAIPTGNFSNDYKPGVNILGDAGYWFNHNWAIIGFLGYNKFVAKNSGIADTEILNFSINLRHYNYFSTTPGIKWSYYIGGGPGIYIPKQGDSKFGFNLGAGINYLIGQSMSAEIGFDYHKTFNSIQFFHNHVGVIFRF